MRARSASLLLVLGLLILAGGWWIGPAQVPAGATGYAEGRLLFPGLASRLADAARVDIARGGKSLRIERHDAGRGDPWGLADKGGYPVQVGALRALLTGLTELRLLEQRTADPALLARLGLDEGSATRLTVSDAAGRPLAALLLGHSRVRTGGGLPEQVYVRRPDETQSWLAEGRVSADADASVWLERDIGNIDHAKVASVAVDRDGAAPLRIAVQDGAPALHEPAEHPPLDPDKLGDVLRAYEFLTLTDVRPAAQVPGHPVGASVFTLADGGTIRAELSRAGDALWARFTGAGGADAAALGRRAAGWAYQIGAWKEKALLPALDDLKADPPALAVAAPSR